MRDEKINRTDRERKIFMEGLDQYGADFVQIAENLSAKVFFLIPLSLSLSLSLSLCCVLLR